MTVISDIIQQAFRESDLIDETQYPTPTQATEALGRLNTIFKSVLGYEVGEQLEDINLGTNATTLSDGLAYAELDWTRWNLRRLVPQNVRLIVQTDEPTTVYLASEPQDGARFALYDPFSLLATNPVTVNGNGRLFESATSVVLNTNDVRYSWIYRAELANWLRVEGLTDASAEMPFPDEFDDYFIGELAIRLNPRHKGNTSQETIRTLSRMRSQLRSRYKQNRQMPSELALWLSPRYMFGRFDIGEA